MLLLMSVRHASQTYRPKSRLPVVLAARDKVSEPFASSHVKTVTLEDVYHFFMAAFALIPSVGIGFEFASRRSIISTNVAPCSIKILLLVDGISLSHEYAERMNARTRPCYIYVSVSACITRISRKTSATT